MANILGDPARLGDRHPDLPIIAHNGAVGVFLHPSQWPKSDLVSISAGLDETLAIEGYTQGAFPMPLDEPAGRNGESLIGWYSPVNRGILPLDQLRVTRSLRKSARRYAITVDAAFESVLDRCADPRRDGSWIDDDIRRTYCALHRRGLAHSVEAWGTGGRLVGGLYGVGLRGFFAGESMFHDPDHGRDASKAALLALVDILSRDGTQRLLDVQWRTDHLASLGVVEIPRAQYLKRLRTALRQPDPAWPARPGIAGSGSPGLGLAGLRSAGSGKAGRLDIQDR